MSQYRYILVSLLLAGMTCAQAQPIVKINPGASECDVTAKAGDPIFQLDATGNVIVTGTMSGSCGGSGPGGTPNFGLSPPASGVTINGGSATVAAGQTSTVPFTYQAYNAASCTVGQPTTTGSCPAITAANGGCTGTGAQLGCSPSSATLTIPTVASMGSNTSCGYTVTANCSGVTSSAVLTVTAQQGGGGGGAFGTLPAACTGAGAVNPIGLTWQRTTAWTWLPGQGTVQGVDATDYTKIFSPPSGAQPWPSSSTGSKPGFTISANNFVALGFNIPGGSTSSPRYFNVNSGSQPVSIALSECPGDFGQQGTHIPSQYCLSNRTGSSNGGVQTWIGGAIGTCTILAGHTYYLNFLDADLPAAGGTTLPTTACTGGVCNAQIQLTY